MAAARSRSSAAGEASGTRSGRGSNLTENLEEHCLQCPVCDKKYDLQVRIPKLLSCSHTLCLPCLNQIRNPLRSNILEFYRSILTGHVDVRCPLCREQMTLSICNNCSNNQTIINVLSRALKDFCSQHDQQKLQFFCEKCMVPVCRDCTVVDHKESVGHVIINSSEACTKYSLQFDDIERSSCELLEKMNRRAKDLTTYLESVCESAPRAKSQINEKFSMYRQILDQLQRDLIAQLDQQAIERKTEIRSRREAVQEHIEKLSKLLDESKCFRSIKDLVNMLDTQKKISQLNAECTQVANDRDEDLQLCHFSFTGTDTDIFLDLAGRITCTKPSTL